MSEPSINTAVKLAPDSTKPLLDDAQVQFFKNRGYLRIESLTNPEEVREIRHWLEKLFATKAGEKEGAFADLVAGVGLPQRHQAGFGLSVGAAQGQRLAVGRQGQRGEMDGRTFEAAQLRAVRGVPDGGGAVLVETGQGIAGAESDRQDGSAGAGQHEAGVAAAGRQTVQGDAPRLRRHR